MSMDSFELNKIAGGVLATLLFMMGLGILSDAIFKAKQPVVAGYALPSAEEGGATSSAPAAAAAPAEPIAVRLASADAKKGEAIGKACTACHSFDKGGANKVGPALYGVVERPKGSAPGFNYSAGLKERAGKGEKWDYESLDTFITSPKAYIAGTAMSYAGLADAAKRADLIAYLRSLSDNPAALPK
jgi:cytochrome c